MSAWNRIIQEKKKVNSIVSLFVFPANNFKQLHSSLDIFVYSATKYFLMENDYKAKEIKKNSIIINHDQVGFISGIQGGSTLGELLMEFSIFYSKGGGK